MADPTALYSYKGDSPTTLPHKIRPSQGVVRTDVSTFTDEEIAEAGFTGPYTIPSFDEEYQRISWNSETLSYVVEDLSDGEIKQKIRDKRDLLLKESDWRMVTDTPSNSNYLKWKKYRQALRDLPNNFVNTNELIWPEIPKESSDNPEPNLTERVSILDDKLESVISFVSEMNSVVGIDTVSIGV